MLLYFLNMCHRHVHVDCDLLLHWYRVLHQNHTNKGVCNLVPHAWKYDFGILPFKSQCWVLFMVWCCSPFNQVRQMIASTKLDNYSKRRVKAHDDSYRLMSPCNKIRYFCMFLLQIHFHFDIFDSLMISSRSIWHCQNYWMRLFWLYLVVLVIWHMTPRFFVGFCENSPEKGCWCRFTTWKHSKGWSGQYNTSEWGSHVPLLIGCASISGCHNNGFTVVSVRKYVVTTVACNFCFCLKVMAGWQPNAGIHPVSALLTD